jgi:endonuclease YncB( thermonuclease family)
MRWPIVIVFAAISSIIPFATSVWAEDALPDIPGVSRTDKIQNDGEAENDTKPSASGQPLPVVERKFPQGDFSALLESGDQEVTQIIDPLTILLKNKELVRLTGIEIPDFTPYDSGPVAQSAKAVLTDMLMNKTVRIYMTKNKDIGRKNRMGHVLYHLSIKEDSDAWVQGTLVRLGLARVRTDKSNPEMAAQLYEQERLARSEKLGLWSLPQFAIQTPEQSVNLLNSYQIVEGRIESASRRQSMIFLNFGKDWRRDFTIGIKSANNRAFLKAKMDVMGLNTKTIRVRGWVREYNGPYIEIDHPELIEIVE